MKTPCITALAFFAVSAQAGRLHVGYSTTRAVQTIIYDCPRLAMERGGRDAESLITTGGTVQLDISGGTPPYSITWHGDVGGGGTCFVSFPGKRTVTVVDAAGERVTRTIRVGTVRRVVRKPCPPADDNTTPLVPTDTLEAKPKSEIKRPEVRRTVGRKEDRLDSSRGGDSGTTVRRKNTEPVGTGRKPVRTAPVRK